MNLIEGLSKLNITYSERQIRQLEQMLDLLNEWNVRHNLTRYLEREDQIIYHVLDSLSAYKFFEVYESILDIGTGAGFPGIPLAIMYPNKQFHLVDSNGKKVAYLKALVKTLGLNNVIVYHERIEKLDITAEAITARALASTNKIKSLTEHMKPKAYILFVAKELEEKIGELYHLDVPGSDKRHGILVITCE